MIKIFFNQTCLNWLLNFECLHQHLKDLKVSLRSLINTKYKNTDLTLDTWSPFNYSSEENIRLVYHLVHHQSLCVWESSEVFKGGSFPRCQPRHNLSGKQALVLWVHHHIARLCKINTCVKSTFQTICYNLNISECTFSGTDFYSRWLYFTMYQWKST